MKSAEETYSAALAAGLRKAGGEGYALHFTIRATAAGAFIALGGLLSVLIGFGFPELTSGNPALQRLLSGLMFPVGLFLVVTFGAELFTGNNALLIPGTCSGDIKAATLAKNWVLVWVGNFAGALIFTALLCAATGTLDAEPWHGAITSIAQAKASLPWHVAFVRGIGANWLVCMAVWLALSATTLPGKALACWIPIATFVMLGYEHSVANMFFIPAGMMAGAPVSIGDLMHNLLPVTAGNIIGGVTIGLAQWLLYGRKGGKR